MTKSITISFDEADENFLIALFDKLKVKTQANNPSILTKEEAAVQERLREKYVCSSTWDSMNEEEKEDAAHAETMKYAQEQPDYHVFSEEESKIYRTELRKKLSQNENR